MSKSSIKQKECHNFTQKTSSVKLLQKLKKGIKMNNTLSKYFSDLYSGNKKLNFKEIYQLAKENKEEIRFLNLADFLDYTLDILNNRLLESSNNVIRLSEDAKSLTIKDLMVKTIKYLVENGIDLNPKSKYGNTALPYAIKLDNRAFVKQQLTRLLIENGVDVNQKIILEFENGEKIKISALTFATYYNQNATKVLLEYGAKLENDYNTFFRTFVDNSKILYNDDRGLLQVAIDLRAHDLIELIVQKHIEENIPFAKGYCLNPLFDLFQEDESGNRAIETIEELGIAANKIIKTLTLFEKAGVKISDHFYCFTSQSASKPIETDRDNTIGYAIQLVNILYGYREFKNTLQLFKHLIKLGAKISDESIRKTILELPKLLNNSIEYEDEDRTSLLMEVCLSKKLDRQKFKLIQFLVENNANIHLKDSMGNTVLFKPEDIYHKSCYIECYKDKNGEIIEKIAPFPSEKIMKYLIGKGADINIKNYMGMTPLMHYSLQGNDRLVKILLDAGADINVKSEVTAYDVAANDKIKRMIASSKNHNPQRLVKLLSNFAIDKPMKYTTHTWDFEKLSKSSYHNFDNFISEVKKQWESIKNYLEKLSPNLHKKIYTFILDKNPSKDYSWCNQVDINIGWSSLEGLKEWCDNGKDPFKFRLKKSFRVNDKTINTFGKVIDLFKQEIEMRDDFNTLSNILLEIKKQFKQTLMIDYDTNKLNKQFYTDVQNIKEALKTILKQMEKRAESNEECNQVDISLRYPDSGYYELKIKQKNSFSPLKPEELLEEVKDGDFEDIKNKLENLCDWSIENKKNRINYLISNNIKNIEELDAEVDGFTHILRFYK